MRGIVFTKDFLEYEELGLFHLEEQYVEEVICEFEEECYIVRWKTGMEFVVWGRHRIFGKEIWIRW